MITRGGCRDRGNSIAGSIDQAAGTSTKQENKNKQDKKLSKDLTKDRKRKTMEKEKSIVDSPAPMSTRARTAHDRKKADMNSSESTCDIKTLHKLQENASSENVKGKTKRKEFHSVLTEIQKTEYPIGAYEVEYKRLSGKYGHSTEEDFMACASPLSSENKFSQISDLLKVSNKKTINKKKTIWEQMALKAFEALALDIKTKDIKTSSIVDETLPKMQYSKTTDEMELNIDIESPEVEQDPSTKKERSIELKYRGIEGTSILQYPNIFDDAKLHLDRRSSNLNQESSLKKENKVKEAKFTVDEFTPMLQFSQDIDERKLSLRSSKLKREKISEMQKESESKCKENKLMALFQCSEDIDERKLNLKSSKFKQKNSTEIQENAFKLKGEENKFAPVLQCSQDNDYRKLNFDLKALKIQEKVPVKDENEITVAKLEAAKSMMVSQVSKLWEANEKLRNVDLNASITTKQVDSSENLNIFQPENKNREELINLKEDVNIRFEFDTLAVKSVLVDNKDKYTSDKNQNFIFNIGDGNVKLSFIDNKVCIFSQRGEIDCSVRKNQLIFQLKDGLLPPNSSPEDPSSKTLSHTEDKVSKDILSTNSTAMTNAPSLDKSEEMQQEQESENVHKLTLKANSSLVPNSLVQRRILNVAENFLAKISSSCDDFEIEFLDCLKKRNIK